MKTKRVLAGGGSALFEDEVRTRNSKGMVGKERHPTTYRGFFITGIIVLALLLVIRISQAQEASPKLNKPNLGMDRHGARGQSASFALTEQQKRALENLRWAYIAEGGPIRREILVLKIELRHLLSDPNVSHQVLFDQQRRISTLQARLEELSLSYQVKARSVFTKEQMERLPEGFTLGMSRMFETDIWVDQELQRGIRR
jgi:hypothetical protein